MQAALPLVREHVDTATVHVRAYHRRAPGVAQASLRTLPFEVGGQRAHLLFTPRELHLAFAVEDLYHLFESLGVPTHRLAWAAGIVLRRASPRTGIWRDRVGALVGHSEAIEILNLMLPEADPLREMAFGRTPERAAILAALDPIFEQTERLCDRCLRDGDWSVFQPRSATSVRPALEA